MSFAVSVLVCASVLIAGVAHGETTASPTKSVTAPCSLVVLKGATRLVYSIVYSVRIDQGAATLPKVRCLGVKQPAVMKDGKVACIVYTCDSSGKNCQQASSILKNSELQDAAKISSSNTSQSSNTEDSIRARLEQRVAGECTYRPLSGMSNDAKAALNQSLPSVNSTGELNFPSQVQYGGAGGANGSDVLNNMFRGDTSLQTPAPATPAPVVGQEQPVPQTQGGAPIAISPATAKDSVALQSRQDPNEIVVISPAGSDKYYYAQDPTSESTFNAATPSPAPAQERGFVAKTGSVVILGGLTFAGVGTAFANPGIVITGIGLMFLGTYMGGL